jgi:CHRD domain-containing protein
MSRMRVKLALCVAVLGVVVTATAAVAGQGSRSKLKASLQGYEEVPAVSTAANGTFKAAISRTSDEIAYTLTYSALDPPNQVTQAHIHFGQRSVNGGITVWLCANPPVMAPPGTQACPPGPATLTGTITPANVIGPAAQGIGAGEFDELVRAMRAGVTYANVHSSNFPNGEIRGQIGSGKGHHGGGNHY